MPIPPARTLITTPVLCALAGAPASAHGVSAADRAFMEQGGLMAFSVLVFGFVHGFGLATKLQDFALPRAGLVEKIVAFNVGVEVGQSLALGAILVAMACWRRTAAFERQAFASNVLIVTCGFVLLGYQLTGYFLE